MQPTRPKLPSEAVELYNLFIHGVISRRAFVDGVKRFAIAGLTVATITEALMPNLANSSHSTCAPVARRLEGLDREQSSRRCRPYHPWGARRHASGRLRCNGREYVLDVDREPACVAERAGRVPREITRSEQRIVPRRAEHRSACDTFREASDEFVKILFRFAPVRCFRSPCEEGAHLVESAI